MVLLIFRGTIKSSKIMKKFAFIIPPSVEFLDLAGPVQVFTEAKFYGFEIDIEFYKYDEDPVSTAGLNFGKVAEFTTAKLKQCAFVLFPGMDMAYVESISFMAQRELFKWLKECSEKRVTVCSICNGA